MHCPILLIYYVRDDMHFILMRSKTIHNKLSGRKIRNTTNIFCIALRDEYIAI